jgi:hypothetical protein
VDFGSTTVERIGLVFGDWFQTAANEELIESFDLR